ncbi:hypothetical protein DY102_04910 [Apilactobacillus timberlakei]|uniref:hypothetical protein n=1 Tax=Apilactobacillus timberlakei TaxID=2008380 RepID=UPI00112E133D|nr:hypothetical protein [Apilactobacillus timberlakei]TPR23386.1 hypothetical protein DY102_04910 [Apilactobacillus timberlakei]
MKTNWKLFGLEMLFFVLPLLIIFTAFNREPNQNSEFVRLIIWLIYCLIFIFLTKLLSKNHPKIKQFYYGINNSGLKNKDSRMLPVYVKSILLSFILVMVLVFILGLYLPNFNYIYGMLIPLLAVIVTSFFLQCTDVKNSK